MESDIFSLGCVYYYILTNGKKLYGLGKHGSKVGRTVQDNIRDNKKKDESVQANEICCN